MSKLKQILKKNPVIKSAVYGFKSTVLSNQGDNSYKYYNYPWNIEFAERVKFLQTKQETGAKRVVYIYPAAEPGTFRYRAYNPTQMLNKSEKFVASYFFQEDITKVTEFAEQIDLLVLARLEWSPEAIALIEAVKRNGGKVAYDFDDLIFNIDFVPDLLTQIAAPRDAYGYYFYYVSVIYSLAKHADVFIATNKFLAAKVEEFFNRKCYVFLNTQNDEQVSIAKKLNKKKRTSDTEKLIGYFSGTKTHDSDFQVVAPTLLNILWARPEVKLMIGGALNLGPEFDNFKDRIIREGLKNYVELEEFIAKCHINIVPLHINDFTNSKSELKYTDAALVKVPTVATPTYTYKHAIEDGVTGMLAKTAEDWEKALNFLLDNEDKRTEMSEKAHAYVMQEYYGKKVLSELEKVTSEIIS